MDTQLHQRMQETSTMIDRRSFIKTACDTLDKQSWLSDCQRNDLEATISHWCQAVNGSSVPFLNAAMKNECFAIINGENPYDEESFCVKEGSDPYQLKLDFLFEDIPYPPPQIGISHS